MKLHYIALYALLALGSLNPEFICPNASADQGPTHWVENITRTPYVTSFTDYTVSPAKVWTVANGVFVLNGVQQPGRSLVRLSGSTSTQIAIIQVTIDGNNTMQIEQDLWSPEASPLVKYYFTVNLSGYPVVVVYLAN